MGDNLISSTSVLALFFLVVAVGVFCYNARLQYKEFKFHSELQPLKRFFFTMSIILATSNLPVLWVFWDLAQNHVITSSLASLVILTYSVSMLATAFLFLIIYRFRAEA
jgi:hypothetical protein